MHTHTYTYMEQEWGLKNHTETPNPNKSGQESHRAQTLTDQGEQNIYVYVNTTCLPVIIRRTL